MNYGKWLSGFTGQPFLFFVAVVCIQRLRYAVYVAVASEQKVFSSTFSWSWRNTAGAF